VYTTHETQSTVRGTAGRLDPAIHSVRNRQGPDERVAITSCSQLMHIYSNRTPSIFQAYSDAYSRTMAFRSRLQTEWDAAVRPPVRDFAMLSSRRYDDDWISHFAPLSAIGRPLASTALSRALCLKGRGGNRLGYTS
jgi:hypothetical protein